MIRDKKYTMIVTEEDNDHDLSFYADNPWEGHLSDITYGNNIDELMQSSDGEDNEGLFYILYENKTGKRIGSGVVEYSAIQEEIEAYENHNKMTKIHINYKMYTDGDFYIENPEEINCQKISDYEYTGTKEFKADNVCKATREAREFLEEFLCEHLRVGASHYWLLLDLYTMIESLIEFVVNYYSGNTMKAERLSGNYEGTEIIVQIEES